jgi:hypothetical protein
MNGKRNQAGEMDEKQALPLAVLIFYLHQRNFCCKCNKNKLDLIHVSTLNMA